MIDIKVTIDTRAVLDMLEKADGKALREKMANAVADDVVLPALHKYPTPSRKKMQWASDKARRFFFAQLRAGAIQVPYRRTGEYGRSFQKQTIPDGVALVSHLAYAPYVRGPGQAAYHKGTWDDLETLALSLEADAALAATAVIVEELSNP